MNDRIKNTFNKLKQENKPALITFLTAGDPNIDMSLRLATQLPKEGVDIIELGMPFSDPMADGPVIQRSYNRALKERTKISDILNLVSTFRLENSITPIILMGYYNPIFKYGVDKFIKDGIKNGIDGVLIVDLPPDADKKIEKKFYNSKLDFIKLITPTTNISRFKSIVKTTTGFIYYVSITGITGAKINNFKSIEKSYKKLKKITKLPFVIGFGINTPEKAKLMAKYADGIVVGSAIVQIIEDNIKNDNNVYQNVTKLIRKYSKQIKISR